MKEAQPGMVMYWKDKLVKVIGINEGHRAVMMEYLEPPLCECGRPSNHQFSIIENSPLYQENTKPVETI